MSRTGSQQRTFLELLVQLRPHWRSDRALPARIQTLLARNRAFGSRDRRLYRELLYTFLRYLPWIEPAFDAHADFAVQLTAWLSADTSATDPFRREVAAGWPACPARLDEKARIASDRALRSAISGDTRFAPEVLLPPWFRADCPFAFSPAQLDALLSRAPLWLRVQADRPSEVTDEFDRVQWPWKRSTVLASAIALSGEVDVTQTHAYQNGLIEIQDLGSQLVLESAAIAPGGFWLDACAGAGGKTLQLARLLGAAGKVDAFDIRREALAELHRRASRAGQVAISILERKPDGLYDGVLVDAPCCGSGTWRRAPHLKWTTSSAEVDAAAALQRQLLTEFSQRVRPGGRLIYATCSLSSRENQAVVTAFLESQPDFRLEPPANSFGADPNEIGLTFLPAQHDTDGFFVAALRRSGGPINAGTPSSIGSK